MDTNVTGEDAKMRRSGSRGKLQDVFVVGCLVLIGCWAFIILPFVIY
jgi:hypothetical protein